MKIPASIVFICALACGAAAVAAGVREESIGIDFPERLGDFTLKGRTQFPKAAEGAVIAYESKDARGAVYVYDAGKTSIPNGVGSPVIHMHFLETTTALQQAARQSGTTLKSVRNSTISKLEGCGPQFLWRTDEISMNGNSMMSRTYLAGLNNRFVKLRVSHPAGGEAQADDFVQRIRRVLGRCA